VEVLRHAERKPPRKRVRISRDLGEIMAAATADIRARFWKDGAIAPSPPFGRVLVELVRAGLQMAARDRTTG
jgi:hypothetical protein